jgi:hypothetical protein
MKLCNQEKSFIFLVLLAKICNNELTLFEISKECQSVKRLQDILQD